MGRVKQQRHIRFQELSNCFPNPFEMKGRWSEWFGNSNPVFIEPGCGKAELSLGMARKYPDRNFLAIDLKSDRLCRGADLALNDGVQNIGFLRMDAEKLEEVFDSASIDGIWLTFPDPYPRDSDEKKRLTNPRFLKIYQNLLRHGAKVYMKTDNDGLMEYTLDVLNQYGIQPETYTDHLHQQPHLTEGSGFITSFEKKFLQRNKNIHYLCFEIPQTLSFFKPDSAIKTETH